ncbi:MAG: thiolase family protein [Syntrophobacteraceae bacterium]
MFTKAYIPFRGYFSSPFSRWQGSFANQNAITLAGDTVKRWLAWKNWDPAMIDYVFLGMTVGQPQWFYGGPWTAALIGATRVPGVLIVQACTTSATCVYQACAGIEIGAFQNPFCVMGDRCSNGPHTIWPNPNGPGGEVISENWNMDNFAHDPWAKNAMIQTGENVAKEAGFTRAQADEATLRRYEQYMDSLANGREFQKRYMFPVEVAVSKKKTIVVEQDEGVTPTTREGLAGLKPVLEGGIHTFGAQTHPADGNCGIFVTTKEKAAELSADPKVTIQVISYGYSRAKKGFMAAAVPPAARMALEKAGIGVSDLKAIKTHNPFIANDLFLASEFGIDVGSFNNYGSSLIFGHPQGPTAGRLIIEGIEEVVKLGGGYFLWAGCAAGDTGAGLVFKIS